MPLIDKFSVKSKYRAWDSDILSKLKISELPTQPKKSDSKVVANWEQTAPKSDSITRSKVVANWEQSSSKNGFFSLTGLQRRITTFVYELCVLERDKKTGAVSICQISHKCEGTIKTVKNAINRLVKKGIIIRNEFKNGRSGWTVYSLSNSAYQEIMAIETGNKVAASWEQSSSKLAPKLAPKLVADALSSGGNLLKTTTTVDKQQQLPVEWQNIDIEPLSEIGFTKNHLTQIALQLGLLPKDVQDSIHVFAFDLKENGKRKDIKGDPIGFFMGILRKRGMYLPPTNYESPQAHNMRLYKERMDEIETKRVTIEKKAFDLAFGDWFNKLTDEQKKELLPEMLRRNADGTKLEKSKILESSAKGRFEREIWPDIKSKIESGRVT